MYLFKGKPNKTVPSANLCKSGEIVGATVSSDLKTPKQREKKTNSLTKQL